MTSPVHLADLLSRLRTTRDLARFFGTLGYVPDHNDVQGGAVVVARWRGFGVIASVDARPRDRVRELARTLDALPGRGAAVALRPGIEMALAAPRLGAPGVTKVLVVPLAEPSPDALEHLARFAPEKGASGLSHALRVDELLASEVAGDRFFSALQIIHGRMTRSIGRVGSVADRRLVALLSLTRVLFLYFVQAKGWLDGRPDYLRRLLDMSLRERRPFQHTALEPLCFATLNTPTHRRDVGRAFGRVPYLNGGLFEQHPAERRIGTATFDNAVWQSAFDDVFERFRFCVREADEVNAIAPDMLGHVFERIMESNERLDTGTFYTPEVIVTDIVDVAIETALMGQGGIDAATAARIVREEPVSGSPRSIARHALASLRVLDPAVGSGAFLLAALGRLTRIRCAIDGVPAHSDRHFEIRRRVLRCNLFGIDLNPIAVRLAELRLWLAVIADDPGTDIEGVTPLPNLDGVLRQGDSLLDPVGAARALGTHPARVSAPLCREIRRQCTALFSARGNDRVRTLRRLHDAERALAKDLLSHADTATAGAIRDLTAAARGRDLFGKRAGLTSRQARRLLALRRQRRALRRARGQLQEGRLPFFSYEIHAAETMASGGFSAIIGNPPWVRSERLHPRVRETLKERFRWWTADGTGHGYAHLPDLSLAFLERAIELARPGAAVALLLPSKLTTASYAQRARRSMVRETTIRYLHRVPDREAGLFGATTYPLAVVLQNTRPPRGHRVRLRFADDAGVRQRSLAETGPWVLRPEPTLLALEELRSAGTALGIVAPPSLGVKTGANAILIGVPEEGTGASVVIRFGTTRIRLPSRFVRRVIRGRDVQPFAAHPGRVVVWAHDRRGQPLPHVPRDLATYIDAHRGRLAGRADYQGGPLWTLFRIRAATRNHRVIWADISRRPRAVAVDATTARDAVPLNSCYVSSAPDEKTALVIAAVLNSTWAHALVQASAVEARGGYRRANARAISPVPVPHASTTTAELARLSLQAHEGTACDQDTLDDAVAEALALSPATRDTLRRLAADHR